MSCCVRKPSCRKNRSFHLSQWQEEDSCGEFAVFRISQPELAGKKMIFFFLSAKLLALRWVFDNAYTHRTMLVFVEIGNYYWTDFSHSFVCIFISFCDVYFVIFTLCIFESRCWLLFADSSGHFSFFFVYVWIFRCFSLSFFFLSVFLCCLCFLSLFHSFLSRNETVSQRQ